MDDVPGPVSVAYRKRLDSKDQAADDRPEWTTPVHRPRSATAYAEPPAGTGAGAAQRRADDAAEKVQAEAQAQAQARTPLPFSSLASGLLQTAVSLALAYVPPPYARALAYVALP
jgi:hypothetical protein